MGRESRLNPFGTTQNREPQVRDAYERILAEGDLILLQNVVPSPWMITKILPAVDPNVPPGMMLVEVKQRLRFLCARDTPEKTFVRVLTKEETAPFIPENADPPSNVRDFPIDEPPDQPATAPSHEEEADVPPEDPAS